MISEDARLASASTPLVAAADLGVAPVFGFQPIGDLIDSSPLSPLAAVQNVIEAAGGGAAVGWASGMIVTGGKSQIVITTDRGRSWLPEGVILPEDVAFPWNHPDSGKWAGLLDPARVIVEYAAAVGGKLTALASTRSSSPGVAAGVPFAIVDPSKRAHAEKIDGDIANRVNHHVEAHYQRLAKGVAHEKQRRQARNLARAACTIAFKLAGASEHRDNVNAALNNADLGEHQIVSAVSVDEWNSLRVEHETVCAKEHLLREDVRDVPVGELDTRGGRCHDLLVTAYSIEALLAVQHQTTSGALEGALYAWSMVRTASPAAAAVAAELKGE
ncbi:MAG: hypothetical protein PHQ28_03005 [Mycobacterium sp.]|nr:hypothetical protein [Mycobacterium sp.]